MPSLEAKDIVNDIICLSKRHTSQEHVRAWLKAYDINI